MRRARIITLVAAGLTFGCGPSAPTVTLGGAVNGTFAVNAGGWHSTGSNYVSFGVFTPSGYPSWEFSISFSGTELQAGTFTNTSANFVGSGSEVDVSGEEDGLLWGEYSDGHGGGGTGTFTLTLSSVGSRSDIVGVIGGVNPGSIWHNPHGTLTSILLAELPANPSTAKVTVDANF
jgi:hypothetical protein